MQSAALKDQTLIGSDNHETTASSSDQSKADITVLKMIITQPETKYRQNSNT